jgi:hypothetical protein
MQFKYDRKKNLKSVHISILNEFSKRHLVFSRHFEKKSNFFYIFHTNKINFRNQGKREKVSSCRIMKKYKMKDIERLV